MVRGSSRRFRSRMSADHSPERSASTSSRAHGLETNVCSAQRLAFGDQSILCAECTFRQHRTAEVKVVSCIRGAILDVIIDLRPHSPSTGAGLPTNFRTAITASSISPRDLPMGFQTLSDDARVSYLISEFYNPQASTGVRWNDPAFAIDWPAKPTVLSDKDQAWPLLDAAPA